ncbi:unnamed protein product [Pieris brassicae]|uniref:Uncharacterized protein n=1 Tax=Pieris brassicae TaxID=7116 RepID=A0A9P0TTY0_PIEBR|nr:unnamed protein product [Pieris brassicae]
MLLRQTFVYEEFIYQCVYGSIDSDWGMWDSTHRGPDELPPRLVPPQPHQTTAPPKTDLSMAYACYRY